MKVNELTGTLVKINQLNGTLQKVNDLTGSLGLGVKEIKYDNILNFATHYDFPNIGYSNSIYVATDENSVYRFDDASKTYYCVGNDCKNIVQVYGGEI